MPLYDYACSVCGHRVEVLHGREASGPTTCEVCGGPMRKLMSAPSVHFKGSGWAKRDRAVAKAPSSARDDGSSSSDKAGDGEPVAPAAKAGDGASESTAASASTASTGSKAPTKAASSGGTSGAARKHPDGSAGSKRATSTTGGGSD